MKICIANNPVGFKYNNGIKKNVRTSYSNLRDNLSFSSKIKKQISPNEFKKRLQELGVDNKTCTTEQVFDCFGIKYEKDEDGKLIIDKYTQPGTYYRYSDYGIKEDDILKDIVEIRGDAFFSGCNAKNLGSVKYIYGSAYFQKSNFEDTNELEYIGKDAYFNDSNMKRIKKVKEIEGSAYLNNPNIEDFGELEYVGKDIWLDSSSKGFGKIKYVGGMVYIVSAKSNKMVNTGYENKFFR